MKPRLWPALVIVTAGAVYVTHTWLREEGIRQDRIMSTLAAAALALVALTVWLALFSRLPRRPRWTAVGAVCLTVLGLVATFRIRGVTGDLLPMLEPRWARTRHRQPPLPPPAAVPAGETPATAKAEDGTLAATKPHEPDMASATSVPGKDASTEAVPTPMDGEPALAWPQFQGPNRDATLAGPRLARDWTDRPPRLLWRQDIGEGWSGFAVAGNVAVTQEQRGSEERVVAYDVRTGRPLWSHADPARYDTVIAGVGPRATPTVEGDRVFTQGATGVLNAIDLRTGRRLWTRDAVAENGGLLPEWGKSGSPLVVAGRVVVSAGGPDGRSLAAYDAATGAPAWAAGSDGSSYSSPVLLTVAGRPQIVILNRGSVAGHDPRGGALLWQTPFPDGQPNVATPLAMPGDRLLVSVGYGVGSKAYRLLSDDKGGLAPALAWESPRLKSKFGNLLWRDGAVYGLDDGVLTCLDPSSGERIWKAGRHGHGQLLLVGGLLLVQTEEGELVLVEATPAGHRELAHFQVLDGKTWNPPALAGRLLVVRNDREAAAYELPTE